MEGDSVSPVFQLDLQNQCLLRDSRELPLRPKTFSVLQCLVKRSGQLVTKEQLLDASWSDRYVSDKVLKVCIRELRKAFEDDPRTPRFIQTVHCRGYRFLSRISTLGPSGVRAVRLTPSNPPDTRLMVGRETELSRLAGCLRSASSGEKQVVLITGEAGIGKTALVDRFLAQVRQGQEIRIARGQCSALCGQVEPFLPVLEALEDLCGEPGSEGLVEVIAQQAPTLLRELPSLCAGDDQEMLARRAAGGRGERMLREIGRLLPALAAETPLVLVLEDLHWSDPATMDLVLLLSQRRSQTHLMLIATYRPLAALAEGHLLKTVHRQLRLRGLCVDLPVVPLRRSSVESYLAQRLAGAEPTAGLVDRLYQLSDGIPLYLVTTVEDLLERGQLAEVNGRWQLTVGVGEIVVAETLREMIQEQIEALDKEDQSLLEVASVAGRKFSALVVAAAVEKDATAVEEQYERLVRRGQFLRSDRVVGRQERRRAERYRFFHQLQQMVLLERLPAARRRFLHRRIGEALVSCYGEQAAKISAVVAMHLEHGGQ